MNPPLFSIITATHNRKDLLKRVINSLLKQSCSDWEMVIIDDSTNNDTQKWFLSESRDPRIRFYKNESNQGVNFSRNRGLEEARGGWVGFLDDDDYYTLNYLEQAKKIIDADPQAGWLLAHHVYPDGKRVNTIGQYGKKFSYLQDMLLSRKLSGDGTQVFRRDLVEDVRFETDIKNGGEWIFWYRLGKKTKILTHNDDGAIIEYLTEGLSQNVSATEKRKNIILMWEALSKDKVSTVALFFRLGPAYLKSFFI